jgi:hypothetical protein
VSSIVSGKNQPVDMKMRLIKAALESGNVEFRGEFEILFKVFDTVGYITDRLSQTDKRRIARQVLLERQTSSARRLLSGTTFRAGVNQVRSWITRQPELGDQDSTTGFGAESQTQPRAHDLAGRLVNLARQRARTEFTEAQKVVTGFGNAAQVRTVLFTTPEALELLAREVQSQPGMQAGFGAVERVIPLARGLSEEDQAAVDSILKSTLPRATRAPDPEATLPKLTFADAVIFVSEAGRLTEEESTMLDLVPMIVRESMARVQSALNEMLKWVAVSIKAASMSA